MNPQRNPSEVPAQAGYVHWFDMPRTIPGRWDMSSYLNPPHPLTSMADMNGTAFDQSFVDGMVHYESTEDTV